ncbi:unnamed protein product [Oikopleura dioica]|uniref:Uncharacterized protein n=1 Tax=Oikopleura dioica TaxID=34765 RepID=E4XKB2_OIKDI|nr:unnamed protein product [Oikopleura dioica]
MSSNLRLFRLKLTYVEGHYSGEELLGAFQETSPAFSVCKNNVKGTVLDAQSNPVMTFTSQIKSNAGAWTGTEVFSQGENVACTIQSATGSHSTANFAAHLPIPIKICLIMRTAQAAMAFNRKRRH